MPRVTGRVAAGLRPARRGGRANAPERAGPRPARRHGVRRGSPRRDDRVVGAGLRAEHARGRSSRGRGRGGPGRHAPALRHRPHGPRAGVGQAGASSSWRARTRRRSTPGWRWCGTTSGCSRATSRSAAMGPAGHRDRHEVRSGRRRHRPRRRGPQPHPGRRRRAGARAPQRSGHGRGLRRARSPLHRDRLLRGRVRAAGARAIRPGRGVDGGDGAVAPGPARGEHPRTLPRPPRRDPPAARVVRRGGEGSARWPARSCAPTCAGSSGGR